MGCSALRWRVSPFGNPRVIAPNHGSPRLIAVIRVLHRRLAPRHPPCTLSSLFSHEAEKLNLPHWAIIHRSIALHHACARAFAHARARPIQFLKCRSSATFSIADFRLSIRHRPPDPKPEIRNRNRLAVETRGFEPLTPRLQSGCSPS